MLSENERCFPFAPPEKDTFDMSRVVDLTPFFSQSHSGHAELSKSLLEHLRTDGFVYIRGLPVQARLVSETLEMAQEFLHNADEGVRRSCLTKDRARRGYSAMNTENF